MSLRKHERINLQAVKVTIEYLTATQIHQRQTIICKCD